MTHTLFTVMKKSYFQTKCHHGAVLASMMFAHVMEKNPKHSILTHGRRYSFFLSLSVCTIFSLVEIKLSRSALKVPRNEMKQINDNVKCIQWSDLCEMDWWPAQKRASNPMLFINNKWESSSYSHRRWSQDKFRNKTPQELNAHNFSYDRMGVRSTPSSYWTTLYAVLCLFRLFRAYMKMVCTIEVANRTCEFFECLSSFDTKWNDLD